MPSLRTSFASVVRRRVAWLLVCLGALLLSLASPYTLRLTSAATVGAALALVFDWSAGGLGSHVVVPGLALVCALGASLMVVAIGRAFCAGVDLLILFCIALVFLGNAIVSLLQFVANATALQQVVFWTLGSVGRATWPKLAVLAAALLMILPWSLADSWRLTALRRRGSGP